MKNRIVFGAVLTLALLLIPGLAVAKPATTVKKKKASEKSSDRLSDRKSRKASKKTASRRSARRVQKAQVYGLAEERDHEGLTGQGDAPLPPSVGRVPESRPLMRIIPQRDGRFLLEPLTPKKPLGRYPSPTSENRQDTTTNGPKYNKWEPWNFSELVLTRAQGYYGAPYRRGASLEYSYGTDCSGFVQYIYQGFKIDLPRSSSEQAQVGRVVTHSMDFSKLLPGDILFFRRGGRYVGHSGIYLGEGKMIHASNHRNGVTITDLRQPYYQQTFVVAKRIFEVEYKN